MYPFPNISAEDDNVSLWSLQCFLINECEVRLGPSASDKQVYQPVFNSDNGGPVIINTPELDGAFASLIRAARTYWPTTLYELAHETVHLLDPTVGPTNFLEEGFAVHFSVDMSKAYTNHQQQPSCPFYLEAWHLIKCISNDVYGAGALIRTKFGKLSLAKPKGLMVLFPNMHSADAERLCSQFSQK
jgi:hypothetical protein